MGNWRAALLSAAAVLCLLGAARADIGDVTYGPWSEWGKAPIENKTNLFVETREVSTPTFRRAWRYTRYQAQGAGGARYAASDAALPGAVKEAVELDQPLKSLGERDGRAVYEGEWFNQTEVVTVDSMLKATEYRAREIFLTSCAIRPAALVAEPGEHLQLGIELLDPGAYSLTSDRPEVASVDQQGLLDAHSPGRARITLVYNGQTAGCDVLVIQQKTKLDEGAAALRLAGTRLTIRYDAGRKEVTGLKLAQEAQGAKADPAMRFLIDNADGGGCSIRALCPRIGYLAAPLSDEGGVQPGDAKVLLLKQVLDRHREIERLRQQKAKQQANGAPTAQPEGDVGEYAAFMDPGGASYRFRALTMPEGNLILCLQADASYALTADRAEAGAGLSIEKLDLDDPRQRWTIEKEKADVARDRVWRLPVPDNSFCQITDDFKTMARDKDVHDGVDFSPNGRERALSVAAGRVVEVDDRCTHDYRKTELNKYGRYIDPCDLKDGVISQFGSYGKYVIVEHADGTRNM